jgi:hypothetical protein
MFRNRLRIPILTGMRPRIFVFALLLAAASVAAAPATGVAGGAADAGHTLSGRLTSEGVECPAFRDEAGALYTLQGDLKGFGPGDAVCLRAAPGGISFCMQGTLLTVLDIAKSCDHLAPVAP